MLFKDLSHLSYTIKNPSRFLPKRIYNSIYTILSGEEVCFKNLNTHTYRVFCDFSVRLTVHSINKFIVCVYRRPGNTDQ